MGAADITVPMGFAWIRQRRIHEGVEYVTITPAAAACLQTHLAPGR